MTSCYRDPYHLTTSKGHWFFFLFTTQLYLRSTKAQRAIEMQLLVIYIYIYIYRYIYALQYIMMKSNLQWLNNLILRLKLLTITYIFKSIYSLRVGKARIIGSVWNVCVYKWKLWIVFVVVRMLCGYTVRKSSLN